MDNRSPFIAHYASQNSSKSSFWMVVAILGSLLLHAVLVFWFQRTYLPYHVLTSHERLVLRKFKLERVEINPKWIEPKLHPPEHVSLAPSPDRSSLTPTPEKRTFAKLLSEAPSSPTMLAGTPQIPQDKPVPVLGEQGHLSADTSTRSQLEQQLQATSEQLLKKSATKPAGAGRPILNTPGAPVAPKPGSQELVPPTQPKVGLAQGPIVETQASAFIGSSRLDDFFGSGGLPPPPPIEKLIEKPKAIDTATQVPQSLFKDKPTTTQKFDSLNLFLNVELFTYEQTIVSSKPEGYFLIRISAKPGQQLSVITKYV